MRLVLRETLLSFRRAPLLSGLSITTIAFALFVTGLFGLVALNVRQALDQVEERVEIVAYLMRGTPVEIVTVAIGDIQSFPDVASVSYVTEDQALERARTELVEFQGIFEEFVANPLPASLKIKLQSGYRDSEHVAEVADRLRGFPFVEDIRYGRDWVAKLDRLRGIAAVVGLVIGGAFAAASVIIIATTIRMAVLQRSREIALMRLVGATDGFIRQPFLLEGGLKGAIGSMIAVALNYAAFVTLDRLLIETAFFNVAQAVVIILFGTALGLGASAVSVGRHLRRVNAR